jgi:hypothetical protein
MNNHEKNLSNLVIVFVFDGSKGFVASGIKFALINKAQMQIWQVLHQDSPWTKAMMPWLTKIVFLETTLLFLNQV